MGKELTKVHKTVFICLGGTCKRKGAVKTAREIRAQIKMHGLHKQTHTIKTHCMGQCESAPVLYLEPEGWWYKEMTPEKVERLINEHLMQNKPLKEHVLFREGDTTMEPTRWHNPEPPYEFEKHQDPVVGEAHTCLVKAWENTLFPLLKDVFTRFYDQVAVAADYQDTPFIPDQAGEVDFEDDEVHIHAGRQHYNLLIAPVPNKPEYKEKYLSRCGILRFFDTGMRKGFYLQNNKEETKLLVECRTKEAWQHFKSVYMTKYHK